MRNRDVTMVSALSMATVAALGVICAYVGFIVGSVKSDIDDVKTSIVIMEEQLENRAEAIKSLPIIEKQLDALLAASLPMRQTPPTDDSEK